MLANVHTFSSYDGGDQGFFNEYFREMKYGPRVAQNITVSFLLNTFPFQRFLDLEKS